MLFVALGTLTGCIGLGDSAGYIKKNGGVTSAYAPVLKGVTVGGDLVFGKVDAKDANANQGGGLSPEDSLNGNKVDPSQFTNPLVIPTMPEAPKGLEDPKVDETEVRLTPSPYGNATGNGSRVNPTTGKRVGGGLRRSIARHKSTPQD